MSPLRTSERRRDQVTVAVLVVSFPGAPTRGGKVAAEPLSVGKGTGVFCKVGTAGGGWAALPASLDRPAPPWGPQRNSSGPVGLGVPARPALGPATSAEGRSRGRGRGRGPARARPALDPPPPRAGPPPPLPPPPRRPAQGPGTKRSRPQGPRGRRERGVGVGLAGFSGGRHRRV